MQGRFDRKHWLFWSLTFLFFIAGGVAANAIAGPVEDLTSGLLGGAIAGAVIGLGEWLVLRNLGISLLWVAATAVGLAIGLAVGIEIFGTGNEVSDLALIGVASGLGVGLGQYILLRDQIRSSFAWIPVTATLWALGWAVTTAIGVDVEQRWAVFGASGAVTVSVLGGAVLMTLAGSTKPTTGLAPG